MFSNRTLASTLVALALSAPLAAAPAFPLPYAGEAEPGQQGSSSQEAAKVGQEAARAAAEAARAVRESLKGLEGQHWGAGKGPAVTEKLSKVLKTSGPVTVVVQNFSGDISVTGAGGSEVRVEATKIARAREASEAKAVLEATHVVIEQQGDRVEIRVPVNKWKEHRWSVPTVEFAVVVPAGSTVDVKSVSGNLTVSGIKGIVAAETVSGNVTASALAGQASLKSVSGNVQVNASTVTGDVTVNSVSGDVTARTLRARGVSASTVSGDIALQDAACDRATVKSMSGNVEIAGPLNRSARYELKSHSGDVRVLVDGKTGFELEATTWSGALSSDLKLAGATSGGGETGMRQRTLQGVFGDGSARIEATSFSGSVTVAKQKPQ